MASGNALAAASGGLVAAQAASSVVGDYNNVGPSPSLSNGSAAHSSSSNQGYHQLSVTSKFRFAMGISARVSMNCIFLLYPCS